MTDALHCLISTICVIHRYFHYLFCLMTNITILVSIKINCPIKNVLKQVYFFTKQHILFYAAGCCMYVAECFFIFLYYIFMLIQKSQPCFECAASLSVLHLTFKVTSWSFKVAWGSINSKMKAKTCGAGHIPHIIYDSSFIIVRSYCSVSSTC